ncbi:hypothetical protein BC826DRAFT_973113 [Russula brevipes]|nr:hypothetical protein BC826DRAFT_973113 [Russula brevipes]
MHSGHNAHGLPGRGQPRHGLPTICINRHHKQVAQTRAHHAQQDDTRRAPRAAGTMHTGSQGGSSHDNGSPSICVDRRRRHARSSQGSRHNARGLPGREQPRHRLADGLRQPALRAGYPNAGAPSTAGRHMRSSCDTTLAADLWGECITHAKWCHEVHEVDED